MAQTSKNGGRPGTEYRLTEFGCDLVGGRSETPEGKAHYREMVGFYSTQSVNFASFSTPK